MISAAILITPIIPNPRMLTNQRRYYTLSLFVSLHFHYTLFFALFSWQDADDSDEGDDGPPPLMGVADSDDEDDIPLANLLSPASKKASVFISFVSCVFLFYFASFNL